MNTKHRQNCMVMVSLCILNIEKSIFKQRRYINQVSKSKRFPLETTKTFIGDASICEDSTCQLSSKQLNFLPLHYEVKSWHYAKIQPSLNFLTFLTSLETNKSIFEMDSHNYFAYLACCFCA